MIHEEFVHAADKLELGVILGIVAGYARSERTAQRILSSGLLETDAAVEQSQKEIGEIAELRSGGDDIPLSGWRDSWPYLQKISARGVAADEETLVRIAEGERVAAAVGRFIDKHVDRLSGLSRYRARLTMHEEIVRRITHAIGPDLHMLDRASKELSSIRKQIAGLRERLRREFAGFAAEKGRGRGEEFVTVRGERYVVSLPRGEAVHLDGIVHQSSASGASLFIEPIEFVGDNNRLDSLIQEERGEIERILAGLASEVYDHRDALLENQEVLSRLDGVAAKASFSARFRCRAPGHSAGGSLVLAGARHPLLERRFTDEGIEEGVRPLELSCPAELRVLVISGPNAGGKTVALKTVGLLVLMDRIGLPVPCDEGTVIPSYGRVFVDIGDDQSIEHSLSTFSSRVLRLKRILGLVDEGSLVLIDEIGDGTDPEEGAALAEATLDAMMDLCGRAIVTTHLRSLKGWAHERQGAVNATLAFDPERLEPLFTLRMGIPGRSWGIEMAGRLGLDAGIVDNAKDRMGESAVRLEELLAHIEHLEQAMSEEKDELVKKERILSELVERYRDRIDTLQKNRDDLVQEARREALDIVTSTRREMENLVHDIRRSQAERRVIRKSKEIVHKRKEDIDRDLRRTLKGGAIEFDALEPGMWVTIVSLGKPGRIESVRGASRIFLELEGGLRVETKAEDLGPMEDDVPPMPRPKATWSTGEFESVSGEIMVRGMERVEALEQVDAYIDKAVLQGMRTVNIIHGIGKGVLKRAIYDFLRNDPRVAEIQPGIPAHGGDGVAVVTLK